MNILTSLKTNRFNDIMIDVDTIEIINPCMLRARAYKISYKIRNSKLLPFRCIFKSNRTNDIIKIDDILSLQITAECNEARLYGSNEIIKIETGKICVIELKQPLEEDQVIDLVLNMDSISYNTNFFNI